MKLKTHNTSKKFCLNCYYPYKVFTPGIDEKKWTLVKMWFNVVDSCFHQVCYHLGKIIVFLFTIRLASSYLSTALVWNVRNLNAHCSSYFFDRAHTFCYGWCGSHCEPMFGEEPSYLQTTGSTFSLSLCYWQVWFIAQ